jgi:HD-like signal output (HDOD) protein
MPVDAQLRQLDIEIPAQPDVLVKLSLLMAEEEVDLLAVAALIETDMGLAAAVMKAVNSSLYGLKGRVQSVQQAITYLGTAEVAAITFEIGLRAAFKPSPVLEPIWQRATQRGVLMGRLAQAVGTDAWAAHSAGLFEECGKAVLFRHSPDHYTALLRAAAAPGSGGDAALCDLEVAAFGVSHGALGAALCESWGLGPAAVASVRHHVRAQAVGELPEGLGLAKMGVLGLSVLAQALMARAAAATSGQDAPEEELDELCTRLAGPMQLDAHQMLRGVRRVTQRLDEALANGR